MKKYLFLLLFLVGFNRLYAQTVSTYAGTGLQGTADGPVSTATFHSPQGIAIDAAGNMYVSDGQTYKIRKITPAGVVSTLAGNGTKGSTDGPGASALIQCPLGISG